MIHGLCNLYAAFHFEQFFYNVLLRLSSPSDHLQFTTRITKSTISKENFAYEETKVIK